VLVVRKLRGRLCICVNYKVLNAVIVKNRNALLIIKEILVRLSKVRYYLVVNIIAAFNCIYIKEGDEHKIAFLTRYRLFKYIIIPFRLYNALGTF